MKINKTCSPPAQLWIDEDSAVATIEQYEQTGYCTSEEAALLREFRERGFIVLRGIIDAAAVAALREELTQLHLRPEKYILRLQKQVLAHPSEAVLPWRSRLLDFYVPSVLARNMVLAPAITRFMHLLYREPAMVFQSLLFTWGSEQSMHKDTAFVVVNPPCTLTATWIALEKVEAGQGELMYYPGSHRDDLFMFADGRLFWHVAQDGKGIHQRYTDFLHQQAQEKGIVAETFIAEPGDVLIWHPNLAHGGSAVTNPDKTRLSLVSHYCPTSAQPRYFSVFGKDTQRAWQEGYYSSRHYDLSVDDAPLAIKI
jgi:ectoine hydroxylase-related dioxygenase (phytanoyl-CoA dioxygenase family)